MALRLIGLLLLLVGAGVFSLPYWVGGEIEAEFYRRTGQVGGALIGAGLVLVVLSLLRRRR